MKKFLLLSALLIRFISFSQSIEVNKTGSFGKELQEVSGMVYVGQDSLMVINDGGNRPILYLVNPQGDILHRSFVSNAKNKDWEDLALDEFGNLYIADIGNNGNRRKNLYILKLKLEEAILQDTVSAEKIKFSYPEQHAFPPDKANLYFDAEALWASDDKLYILTKNRTEPCDGIGFLYQLPTQTGTYTAKKMGEYSTCNDMIKCWITAADFNPKTNTLAILTTKSIHLVLFEQEQLTTVNVYEILGIKQRESITFSKNGSELFIADEFHKLLRGGNIYKVSIHD